MALSYSIFSLVHLLVDYAFGGAIGIAYGDRDGGNEDGRDSVRRAANSGGHCATKTTPPIKTFVLRVLQHPMRPAVPIHLKQIDHTLFIQRKRRPWPIKV